MMLSDMGADVVRIDRKSAEGTGSKYNVLNRGRKSIAIDLKKPEGLEIVLALAEKADIFVQNYRKDVAARLENSGHLSDHADRVADMLGHSRTSLTMDQEADSSGPSVSGECSRYAEGCPFRSDVGVKIPSRAKVSMVCEDNETVPLGRPADHTVVA